MLKLAHCQIQLKFARYHEIGLLRIERECYGQMKLKSIALGQIARYMSGNNKGNYHQIALQHLLLNMGGKQSYGVGLYGVKWSWKAFGGSGKDEC